MDIFSDGRRYFDRVKSGEESSEEIQHLEDDLILENRWVKFFNNKVKFPSGATGSFLRISTPDGDGTVIVAVKPNTGKIAVVKQYRYAPAVWEIGLPRGFANLGDEDAIMTGFREFSEEVGGHLDRDRRWSLGRVLTDSGKLSDAPHILLAEVKFASVPGIPGLEAHPDETEVLVPSETHNWVPFEMLQSWVECGKIVDMFTCAAVARLRPHFNEYGKFFPDLGTLMSQHLIQSESFFE